MLTKRFFENIDNSGLLWRVNSNVGGIDQSVIYDKDTIINESNKCRIECEYETDKYGVFVRQDNFTNLSDKDIRLSALKSRFVFQGGEYEVYTQYNNWQTESMGAWQPLVTQVAAGCQSTRSTQDAAPFMVLWSKQENRGVVFHLLPGCAWEIKVTRVGLPQKLSKAVVELGISEYNMDLCVNPGQTVTMPKIICYETTNRIDFDCFKLHNYMHTNYPRKLMPMIYNTWLYRFIDFTPELLMNQAKLASEMGLEYFVVDAGWFGRGNVWFTAAGDWEENLTGGLFGRMKELADYVRSLGMKFGFWLEPERAGKDSLSTGKNPKFYIQEGENYFLDFANKDALLWITDVTLNLIETYGIEYIKFDYNANMFADRDRDSYLGYHEGIGKYLKAIRDKFPGIYLSGCAGGGERTELDNYIKYDSFWPTDNESPMENMRMFKETILRMPPQGYEKWTAVHSLAEYDDFYKPFSSESHAPTDRLISCADAVWYNLTGVNKSYLDGYHTCSPVGFSCDLSRITPDVREYFKNHIEKIKAERDFWITAVARILCDTETVTVYQYSDMELNKVVVQVMTAKNLQDSVTVFPCLRKDAVYVLDSGEEITGTEIMENGIEIKLGAWYEMSEIKLAIK